MTLLLGDPANNYSEGGRGPEMSTRKMAGDKDPGMWCVKLHVKLK